MKIVHLRRNKKVALPPSSIVTRSISRHRKRMAEQAVEDVSAGLKLRLHLVLPQKTYEILQSRILSFKLIMLSYASR